MRYIYTVQVSKGGHRSVYSGILCIPVTRAGVCPVNKHRLLLYRLSFSAVVNKDCGDDWLQGGEIYSKYSKIGYNWMQGGCLDYHGLT